MPEKKDDTTESAESTESTESSDAESKAGAKRSTRSKKSVEDKLDDLADRFSRGMTDGVKRMEAAFDRGMENLKNDPNIGSQTTRVKSFFKSSTGGVVLILIGFVWFFYTIGWFDSPVFPILLIILGFYLMQRYKNE
jgi:hypothetical protein